MNIRNCGVAVTILLLFGCGEEKTAKKIPTPVRVRPVQAYSAGNEIRYTANIEANNQVQLAFKTGGYVDGFFQVRGANGVLRDIQSGDVVKRGTVLARLRKSDFQTKVEQARGQLGQAQAVADNSELELDRATRLYETESVTKSDFDGATARAHEARARSNAATAQLREAEIALRDSDLRAPTDAIVVQRNLEVGDLASPGAPAFVLADVTSVKAIFGVPDVLISGFQIGQKLSVLLEAIPGVILEGSVTQISPVANSRTRLFETEITVPNSEGRIKPGMIASIIVRPPSVEASVLVVPLTSIIASRSNRDRYAVMVLSTKGDRKIANLREITLGETYGDLIAVNDGLRSGESVITVGATLVEPGQEVSVIP